MKVFTCFSSLLLLVCLLLFPQTSKGNNYLTTSSISLYSPEDNYRFSLRDSKTFRWYGPNPAIDGNRRYVLKIVEVLEGQTSDQAIASNEAWLLDTSATIANNELYEKTITKNIPTNQKMAWQVKAIDDSKIEIAISQVFTFYGPKLIEGFYAGNHVVRGVETSSTSIDDITGYGFLRLKSGADYKVYFEHIKVGSSGALLVMRSGEVKGKYDGSTIQIKPRISNYGNAEFTADSIKADVQRLYLKGVVKWVLPASVASNNITIETKPEWITYENCLIGTPDISDTLRYSSAFSEDLKFEIYPSSYFILTNYSYEINFSGKVTTPIVNLEKKDSISFEYKQIKNLEYFTLVSSKPLQYNEVVDISANSAIMDLSETKSPITVADPAWKGIYFDTYDLLFKTDNTTHDLKIKDNKINFKSSSAGSKFLISSGNLQFVADTNFVSGVASSYNGFSGYLNKIFLSYPLPLNKREQIVGSIDIPYIKSDKLHDLYLNFSGVNCTDSLGDNITDFAFSQRTDKDILTFSAFDGSNYIPATIDQNQKTIDFILSQSVDLKNVVCYFSTSGKKVTVNRNNQYRGVTKNDFTTPKNYVVTAADGSSQSYKVSRIAPTAITDEFISNNIQVYPNPTSDIISIKNISGIANLSIFSVDGKLVYQDLLLNSTNNISLANLQPGFYIVVIKTDKEIYQTKLLKK